MKKALNSLAAIGLTVSFSSHAIIPEYNVQYKKNVKGDVLEIMNQGFEPENWFNLSPLLDQVEGVSTEEAYQKFGNPSEEIIVAVIDSGVDVNHEDLQGKIWVNQGEIADNGIDDDQNGYIDDVFGWNFIGNEKGMAKITKANVPNEYTLIKGDPSLQVDADTLEIAREVVRLRKLKKELNSIGYYLSPEEKAKLENLSAQVKANHEKAMFSFKRVEALKIKFFEDVAVLKKAGVKEISLAEVSAFEPKSDEQKSAQEGVLNLLYRGFDEAGVLDSYNRSKAGALFHYNIESDTRKEIVKDNIDDKKERIYGNNDVIGPDSSHGTHVAGIIAAARDNGIGMNGVASNVKIMAIRAVPNGDERDKDVANSIYYAVDNGAKVINMSFGKGFSPYKTVVDEAVKYAESKGVLLVHAAGNSNQNNDNSDNFPNKYVDGSAVANWIEVGASTYSKGSSLAAGFSNYGKASVDVFAPGQNINATFPDNTYATISGTSMASPVVAGVAAMALGHFPEMAPAQLKETLMSTSNRYAGLLVNKRGIGRVYFSELSSSGGIVNLFSALEAMNASAQENLLPLGRELATN